jgi:hypothetical protein
MSKENFSTIRGFFGKMVNEHIQTYKDGEVRDFIDMFLREKKKRESLGKSPLVSLSMKKYSILYR